MRIAIICPAPPGSLSGNRVTALRWARILRDLGHHVTISGQYDGGGPDLLVALHARRSAKTARDFHKRWPDRPLVVALTGTDVYHDIHHDAAARRSLELATRLTVLQPLAIEQLPAGIRGKARVIHQSVIRTPGPIRRRRDTFDVCVAGHLREVKDPFRTALSSRLLPAASRIRVMHAGAALEEGMAEQARAEECANPRYHWLGELSRARTRRLIAASRLLVLTSRMEGGANVISEAVVDGVPVLSSRIDGSVGLLGEDYPGYFPVGDTQALAGLLERAESDRAFYRGLQARCRRVARLFRPARERAAWRRLAAELHESAKVSSRT